MTDPANRPAHGGYPGEVRTTRIGAKLRGRPGIIEEGIDHFLDAMKWVYFWQGRRYGP